MGKNIFSKNVDLSVFYQDFQKLKLEFYAHNHNDIVPSVKGDKSNVLTTRFLKVGSTATTNPAIEMAIISTDPTNPSNGDLWFDGSYLHIRIGNATLHIVATSTSTSTTTSTSTSSTTTSSSTTIT